MNYALNQLLPKIGSADSGSIERLASVCMVVQETQSADVDVVVDEMQRWKGDKFSREQVEKSLQFIKEQGWDKKLIKS